mgnify:CR=1 FL=1
MANSSVINLLSGEPGWETRNFDAELQKFQEKNIKEEEIAKIFGVGKSELPLKKRMMRDMVRKLMEMAGENIQKKKSVVLKKELQQSMQIKLELREPL